MSAFFSVLAGLYRRWKFPEEAVPAEAATPARKGAETREEELARLRVAMAREERRLEDFRRNRCTDFVRQCEASLRFIRSRIQALELNARAS